MGKDPSFQMYCNDWLASPSIMMMEPLEELAYFRMLLFMWQSGDCSIPNDAERMGRLTRTNANTCSIVFEQVLITHPTKPDCLTNQRLYDLWTTREEYRRVRAEAGKKSGESRRNSKARREKEQTRTHARSCSNNERTNAKSSTSSSTSSPTSSSTSNKGGARASDESGIPPEPHEPPELQRFRSNPLTYAADFFEAARRCPWVLGEPKPTDRRERLLIECLRDPTWDWRRAFRKRIQISGFSVDKLLSEPERLLAVLEGTYDQRFKTPGQSTEQPPEYRDGT